MDGMSTAAAAERLGLSTREVERLAKRGDLLVRQTVGRALLLDTRSVHRLAKRERRRGRPLTAASAWAALTVLSGQRADWLHQSTLSRLRHRLRGCSADEFAWMVRRRATSRRMQGWGRSDGLLPTGAGALRDGDMSALFGLTPVERGIDGYVTQDVVERVVADLGLIDDVDGDVTVRVIPGDAGFAGDHTLLAVVAVDLFESLDTRESSAGRRVLDQLLADFRNRRR